MSLAKGDGDGEIRDVCVGFEIGGMIQCVYGCLWME